MNNDILLSLSTQIRNLNNSLPTIKNNTYVTMLNQILTVLNNGLYKDEKEKIKYEQLLQKYMTPEISEKILSQSKVK